MSPFWQFFTEKSEFTTKKSHPKATPRYFSNKESYFLLIEFPREPIYETY